MENFECLFITPEVAREMLTHNKSNRSCDEKTIASYARDMKNGDWENYNPSSTIVFDKNGDLIDGQHRLKAIIASNTGVGFYVVRNSDCRIFDKCKVRSTYNTMQLNGYSTNIANQRVLSITRYHLVNTLKLNKPSDTELINYTTKHSDNLVKAVRISTSGSAPYTRKTPVMYAMYCALECNVSEDDLRRFCNVVNNGFIENPSESAAIVFRNFAIKSSYSGNPRIRIVLSDMCQSAIQDFLYNRPRKKPYSSPIPVYTEKMMLEESNQL